MSWENNGLCVCVFFFCCCWWDIYRSWPPLFSQVYNQTCPSFLYIYICCFTVWEIVYTFSKDNYLSLCVCVVKQTRTYFNTIHLSLLHIHLLSIAYYILHNICWNNIIHNVTERSLCCVCACVFTVLDTST